jgi:hypothetical protein
MIHGTLVIVVFLRLIVLTLLESSYFQKKQLVDLIFWEIKVIKVKIR